MKSTTNAFSKGLTTDLHPMQVANTQLTDALNATFVTYNGNELMLQNDMGNTRIQDSATGAIMGLKEGFIPVGMKEHGGIMYIASYNPKHGVSELGSIPSPVFNYSYNFDSVAESKNNKLLNLETFFHSDPISISNERFGVGDMIFCDFDITEGDSSIIRFVDTVEKEYPTISTNSKVGLISLHLYADCDNTPQTVDLNVHREGFDLEENRWYHRWDKDKVSVSEDGTLYTEDDKNLDIHTQFESTQIIHYPNFQSGTLSIKPEIEYPHSFKCLENTTTARLEPYYYKDEDDCIWVIFPGLSYVINGPLWVDKIEIKVLIDEVETSELYTSELTKRLTDYNFYSSNYSTVAQQFKHLITDTVSYILEDETSDVSYENEIYSGGLFAVRLGVEINTTLDIQLKFFTDVNYTSKEIQIGKNNHIYNKKYYNNSDIASADFIEIGQLKVIYNPMTPSVLGNISVLPKEERNLKISHTSDNEHFYVDFSTLLCEDIPTKQLFNLSTMLGPQTGVNSVNNSRLSCQGALDSVVIPPAQDLVEQIPRVTQWVNSYKPGLDYSLWILGTSTNVNNWYGEDDLHNGLQYFCSRASKSSPEGSTRVDTQYYTLCVIKNDSIETPMSLGATITFNPAPLKDLQVYSPHLGSLTFGTDVICKDTDVVIKFSHSPGGKVGNGNLITLSHAFQITDSIESELNSVLNNKAFLHLPESDKVEGLSQIQQYVFGWHGGGVATSIYATSPTLEGYREDLPSVVVNLDATSVDPIKLNPDISFEKISNLTYGTPAAYWGRQSVKDLSLNGGDSCGILSDEALDVKVEVNNEALIVDINAMFMGTISDAPSIKNNSQYSVVPYLVFEGQSDGQPVSYPLKNSSLPQLTSIDTTKNYYYKDEDWGEYGDIFHNYHHSFGPDYLEFQPKDWKEDVTIWADIPTGGDGWYIVKWSTIPQDWNDIVPGDYCVRLVYLTGGRQPITINSSPQEEYYIYNFGVFKIIDPKLIDSFNRKYPSITVGELVSDLDSVGSVALPHCMVLYENTTRFKDIGVSTTGEDGSWHREGLKYRTIAKCPPQYYCYGYYTFGSDIYPIDINSRSQPGKKSIIEQTEGQTVKFLTNY